MQIEKTVFISYRRTNAMTARAVYQDLTAHGYDCFIDFQSIDSGAFDQIILRQIAAKAHFVLILTPSALERCPEPGDWLKREIEEAMRLKRNIVPVMFEDFDFKIVEQYLVGDYLPLLKQYNGVRFPVDYFEEAMAKLRTRFLDKPLDSILHPIPATDRAGVAERKAAANAQPEVRIEQLSAEQLLENGNRETDAQNYNLALQHYSEAIRLNPQYVYAYNNRGNAYRAKGDLDSAIRDFDQAIRLDPQYALAYANRGYAHGSKGDLDSAIRDLDQAVQLDPQYALAYANRGYARQLSGDLDGAIRDFDEAIRLNPQDAFAYNKRNAARQAKGDFAGAMRDAAYEQALLKVDPQNPRSYLNRGVGRQMIGDLDGALSDYQKYQELGGGKQDGNLEKLIQDLKQQLGKK